MDISVRAIRPFRSEDLEALYAISLATGHLGGDASHLYKDGKLIGHIYSVPYALLEPQFALVIEDERGVAGFAVGTPDTEIWQQRLEAEWWPALRQRHADPSAKPASEWSADERRAHAIHHPRRTPQQVAKRYPAHLHLNLSERIQGRGAGTVAQSEPSGWGAPEHRLAKPRSHSHRAAHDRRRRGKPTTAETA